MRMNSEMKLRKKNWETEAAPLQAYSNKFEIILEMLIASDVGLSADNGRPKNDTRTDEDNYVRLSFVWSTCEPFPSRSKIIFYFPFFFSFYHSLQHEVRINTNESRN